MKILRKNLIPLLFLLVLSGLYFLLRLPNLTLQPIFADEAIYIRWAQVMKSEPTLRFLPLSDGKTPLFMWILMPVFKVIKDPLFAGRFLSVVCGYGTLLGAFFLSWRFFNTRVAVWSAFLMTVTPLIVFFDRMALVDSMLSMFSIWALFCFLLLIKYPRIDLAMVLGFILGGGILTKTPGFFNSISIFPATLLLINWKSKSRQTFLIKFIALLIIASVISLVTYNLLRLGPGFVNLSSRNQDYIFSPFEVIKKPWDPFLPHVFDLANWLPKLLTPPILILSLTIAIWIISKKNKTALAILIWSFIPLIIQMFLIKSFTARYILFSIPPLLCLIGWSIDNFLVNSKKYMQFSVLVSILILVFTLNFDIRLLINPELVNLPKNERRGYLEDWTAGYGLRDIAAYLNDVSKSQFIVVGTEGSFGTLPDGLQIYFDKNINTVFLGGRATVSAQLKNTAREHPTFFVANKSRYSKYADGVVLLKEYPKAEGSMPVRDSMLLFEVLPEKEAAAPAKNISVNKK